jgi:hypothetical protein
VSDWSLGGATKQWHADERQDQENQRKSDFEIHSCPILFILPLIRLVRVPLLLNINSGRSRSWLAERKWHPLPLEGFPMLLRTFAAIAALFLVVGPASAQVDPEPKTPYLWRIVLKAEPHPLLSAAFREQLKHDLVAALQPALGTPGQPGWIGTVDVVELADLLKDKDKDPLYQQFDDNGFAALTGSRDLNGAKTHFLKLEYRDGQYFLESRQHDGFAGLASPLVRKQSVRAPELVGRTAGLMLDRDFGLTGSIEPSAVKVDEVKVIVRGGQLGPLDHFVKPDDVFAVSEVTKTNRPAPPLVRTSTGKIIAPPPGSIPPPGLTATPRAFTLLRVIDVNRDGTLRCGVLSQFEKAVPQRAGIVTYRCMKLGTIEAPLTVRLVSDSPSSSTGAGAVTVRATESGFSAAADVRDALPFQNGLFRSGRDLKNVACVTVSLGPTQTRIFPVPILGPDPVALPFEVNPKLEERAAHLRGVIAAFVRVADARNAQTICFDATAKLIEKQKNEEAWNRAKGGWEAADAVDKGVSDELARLQEYSEKSPEATRLIKSIEQNLVVLRQFNAQLAEHVKTLDGVVKREKDPKFAAIQVQADALRTRITLLLGRGDVDEAISAYNNLAQLDPENAEIKAAREKLIADWKPKSDAHAKARDYLLKTWPAVATIPDFRDSLPEVGRSIDECLKNNDRYALRKLLTIFNAAAVKLNDLAEPLDKNSDADRKLAADANKVGEALAARENAIADFLKKGSE